MKVGELVKIVDGSWSIGISEKGLAHTWNKNMVDEVFEIVAIDCKLPTNDEGLEYKQFNNTIIRRVQDGLILFTQKRFLSFLHKCNMCPKCGERIK